MIPSRPFVSATLQEGGPVESTGPLPRLHPVLAVVAAALLVVVGDADAARFLWRSGPNPPGFQASGDTLARRAIQIEPGGLLDLAAFTLFLPDSSTVDVGRVRAERPAAGAIVWHGRANGDTTSIVTLSQFGQRVVGSIRLSSGRFFRIRSDTTGTHYIEQFDPSTHPDDGEPHASMAPADTGAVAAETCASDGFERIDLLVLYSDDAGVAEGGPDAMAAKIYLAVAETNDSYRNSRILQSIYVVHIAEVEYLETGDVTAAYYAIKDADTDALREARDLRDTYGADIVAFIIEDDTVSCGDSSILDALDTSEESWAFAAVTRRCATAPDYSFAHELGHVMGAKHDWDKDPSSAVVPYAHGYVQPTPPSTTPAPWRTIMGHKGTCEDRVPSITCNRIPYWSNPQVKYFTEDTGVAGGTRPADNARALNVTAPIVANFRCYVPQRGDPWMRDTWADDGQENPVDPALAGEPMWKSPYIWVRNAADPTFAQAHRHENPIAGQQNYAYVKIHGGLGTMSGDLDLFTAKASTGLRWPADWNLIRTASVVSLGVQETRIVEFPWTPIESGHYCLVARWRSASDPLPGPEFEDIHHTVRAYNNFVWRNVNIIDLVTSSSMTADVQIDNATNGSEDYSLSLVPSRAEDQDFFAIGQVAIKLDRKLMQHWVRGGARSTGIKIQDGRLLVTNPEGARLDGVRLTGNSRAGARITFSREDTKRLRDRRYEFDFVQSIRKGSNERIIGGVSYTVFTGAKAR